jgi:uncharacterized protein (TIGR03435 family)
MTAHLAIWPVNATNHLATVILSEVWRALAPRGVEGSAVAFQQKFFEHWDATWTAALVNHLWQSTVVAGVAWLLALALGRNHARVRYWVWFAASAKFLLPFSLLTAAGEWIWSLMPVGVVAQPAVAQVMEQMTQPFDQTQFFTAAPTVSSVHHVHWLPWMLLAVWASGALIVVGRFARGWWKVYAAKREAQPFEFAADVTVLVSPAKIEPGIFGIFRPVLLLPEGLLERLSPEQLRAVIAHEMAHVRRRDNLTFAIHMVVEALFWFHPFVWWIGSRLIDERERACDEAVVEAGGQAQAYAEGILSVCKLYVESPLGCVSGVTGADLRKRIVRIMANSAIHKIGLGRKLLLVAASGIAVVAPIALGIVHMARVNAQAAAPQGIVGIWQGTLHNPQSNGELRTEIRIMEADGGRYKATVYNIDQGGQPVQANLLTFANGVLKYSLVGFGGSYEGKMSEDGGTITGTWTQGPKPEALVLVRTNPGDAWPVPEPMKPMAADAMPRFDVVTIKPSAPGETAKKVGFNGHSFHMRGANLNDMIVLGYGLHAKQIVGAPAWAITDLYDVEGVPDLPGIPDQKQRQSLVRNLLTDRLQLRFHQEKRELAVYAITVAGGGPKVTKTTAAPNDPQGFGFQGPNRQGVTLRAHNLTMADFAMWMQGFVMDRPVVDQTGLTDRYDFELKWMPDDSQFAQFAGTGFSIPPPGSDASAPPSLYTAMQEQLGLKIEATKAPDDVMVIDQVQKPSPN